ncbi:MAG: hypothetical protein M3419_12255 [Actinomycetota bacterium]|nr:hypothetical protein [Actinomycetota bacterium]
MRPERFLGSDPTPGDLAAVDRLAADLREVVIALSAARRHLDALVGPGSLWHGRDGRGLVEAVSDLARRLRVVEDAVVDLARALESWRTGLVQRQERTAALTEWMSQLSGSPDAEERRLALRAETAELAADHESDASSLASAAEALSLALTVTSDEPDLAADLGRRLTALAEAVEQWMAAASQPLASAVRSVEDAADLTAAVSVLVGFDGEVSQRAHAVGRLSTGAHRVELALQQSRAGTALPNLPRASFDRADVSLAQRLRGQSEDDGGSP